MTGANIAWTGAEWRPYRLPPCAVPNSSGTAGPKFAAPANSCDCHMHIYDGGRFPPPRPESRMQPNADAADYRLFQKRIGTSRVVVVTPAAYATDNEVTLDAIAQLGTAGARRGCGSSDDHGRRAQAHGCRRRPRHPLHAVRSKNRDNDNGHDRAAGAARPAARLAPADSSARRSDRRRGRPAAAPARDDRVRSSRPTDAAGGIGPSGLRHHPPAARQRPHLDEAVRRLFLRQPRRPTRTQPRSRGPTSTAAPERMVWGSDWPHPTEAATKPDDAVLFDLLADWAPDEATRHRILVENPATLYGFP